MKQTKRLVVAVRKLLRRTPEGFDVAAVVALDAGIFMWTKLYYSFFTLGVEFLEKQSPRLTAADLN